MKVSGTKSFDAPRELVWEVLNDPERMAQTMPGVESFEVADDAHWSAKVKVPLGMGGMRLTMNFEKTGQRPIEFAALRAKGQGVGAIVSMETRFNLSEREGGTAMDWEADVRIAGPVGSMGQRVLQPIVNQQVGNVLKALEQQVAEARGGDAAAATPARATPEAEPAAVEGSSGAEEGVHPASPEAYASEPEGPTHSTEDSG
jgi:uncharacterized protein